MNTFYHATYRTNLPSIQTHGLGGKENQPKNFESSQEGFIYLAEHPGLALGFLLEKLLTNPLPKAGSPQEYLNNLIVIKIPALALQQHNLQPDPNIKIPGFWIYPAPLILKNPQYLTANECFPKG